MAKVVNKKRDVSKKTTKKAVKDTVKETSMEITNDIVDIEPMVVENTIKEEDFNESEQLDKVVSVLGDIEPEVIVLPKTVEDAIAELENVNEFTKKIDSIENSEEERIKESANFVNEELKKLAAIESSLKKDIDENIKKIANNKATYGGFDFTSFWGGVNNGMN